LERTKAERIAHLKAEIERLDEKYAKPGLQEIKIVCIEALQDRIEMILRGEV
jgi:hypothetical protein